MARFQKGNAASKGHGAPKGSKNALKHGAYTSIDMNHLSDEDKAYINKITLNHEHNLLFVLQTMMLKEKDLREKMRLLETSEEQTYLNKIEKVYEQSEEEDNNPSMIKIIEESKFDRYMKLFTAYDRLQGRIAKLLDTIETCRVNSNKIELERQKLELAKQKISGEVDMDLYDIVVEDEKKP